MQQYTASSRKPLGFARYATRAGFSRREEPLADVKHTSEPERSSGLENLDRAVARLLAGDASAFQQIVDATSPALVRLSVRMLGNMADGEDVMQEAYVKAQS